MELKDFIKTVITDIIDGIAEIQEDIVSNNKDGRIAPMKSQGYTNVYMDTIEFDLQLGETESNSGKIGVFLVALNFGASGNKETKEFRTSNVKFKIPVSYPCHENKSGQRALTYWEQ